MSLISITTPTMNLSDSTSKISKIGTLDNDLSLYLIQGKIPEGKYPRLKETVVIMVNTGDLKIEMNGQIHHLSPNSLVYLPPNSVYSINSSDTTFKGYIFTFSTIFIKFLQIPIEINKKKALVRQSLSEDIQYCLNQVFMLIKEELSDEERLFRKEKLLNLTSIFFINLLNLFEKNDVPFPSINFADKTGSSIKISKTFLELVKEHSREYRRVKFYAEKLCITPKYLTFIVKRSTGKSANEWITSSVIAEAKYLLRNTENSIKEVADMLHFSNQSFFGKYFKKIVGISPKNYQKDVAYYS